MDISYGVYLFAFPIQQFVVMLSVPFGPGFAMAISMVVMVAVVSAVVVEQPALRLAKYMKHQLARRGWRF